MNKKENISKATEELEKIINNENEKNKFKRILKLEENILMILVSYRS